MGSIKLQSMESDIETIKRLSGEIAVTEACMMLARGDEKKKEFAAELINLRNGLRIVEKRVLGNLAEAFKRSF